MLSAATDLNEDFNRLCQEIEVVIACRVTPQQKADIVKVVKCYNKEKIVMAIGDGTNDVNMILQSDVGVGIQGKEGSQAARAADYSISMFKHIKPLLFVHGREAIRRNSTMLNINFYKNVVIILIHYYLAFWNGYSGQVIIEPLAYMGFNFFFT